MPIRSMTAFASAEQGGPDGTLACELRAVNHRFLEIGLRLPEELRALEPALRERIAARIGRGKLELGMRLRGAEGAEALQLDPGVVGQLSRLAQELHARFPMLRVELTDLLQYPGLLDQVLDAFVAAREREGGKLAEVIRERVDAISRIVGDVRGMVPAIRAGQRQKLEARLADLPQQADPGRLEQELVLSLQKLDVDEELDRLDSHVAELRRVLRQDAPVGRRLDFLLQEFNREANTLGSKSVDARTSAAAVELKVLIDQIREQAQNIE